MESNTVDARLFHCALAYFLGRQNKQHQNTGSLRFAVAPGCALMLSCTFRRTKEHQDTGTLRLAIAPGCTFKLRSVAVRTERSTDVSRRAHSAARPHPSMTRARAIEAPARLWQRAPQDEDDSPTISTSPSCRRRARPKPTWPARTMLT